MIDDADVPPLFAIVIVSAIVAVPSVETILEMAATSAVIGLAGCAAVAILRGARRSRRRTLGSETSAAG